MKIEILNEEEIHIKEEEEGKKIIEKYYERYKLMEIIILLLNCF